jgi:hypothetical protein
MQRRRADLGEAEMLSLSPEAAYSGVIEARLLNNCKRIMYRGRAKKDWKYVMNHKLYV